MPIILVLLLIGILAGLMQGGVQLFNRVNASAGVMAAILSLLVAVAILLTPFILWRRHHLAIHGKKQHGQRIVELAFADGSLRLDALQKRGHIQTGQGSRAFIFADIDTIEVQGRGLTLLLRNPVQPWHIRPTNAADLRRWHKILRLAASQDL